MSGKSVKFGDKRITKSNFYKNKKPCNIENINVDKILISKKESYGSKENSCKYFIGYNDSEVITPLFVRLP